MFRMVMVAAVIVAFLFSGQVRADEKPLTINDWLAKGSRGEAFKAFSATLDVWKNVNFACREDYIGKKMQLDGFGGNPNAFLTDSQTVDYAQQASAACSKYAGQITHWIDVWNAMSPIRVGPGLRKIEQENAYTVGVDTVHKLFEKVKSGTFDSSLKRAIVMTAIFHKACNTTTNPDVHGIFSKLVQHSVDSFYRFAEKYSGRPLEDSVKFYSKRCP